MWEERGYGEIEWRGMQGSRKEEAIVSIITKSQL